MFPLEITFVKVTHSSFTHTRTHNACAYPYDLEITKMQLRDKQFYFLTINTGILFNVI